MAPGLQSWDLAVIRPAEEFNREGLYLVSLLGSEMLRRVFQTADGKYTANCDKRDHYPGIQQSNDYLLGRGVATVSRVWQTY